MTIREMLEYITENKNGLSLRQEELINDQLATILNESDNIKLELTCILEDYFNVHECECCGKLCNVSEPFCDTCNEDGEEYSKDTYAYYGLRRSSFC